MPAGDAYATAKQALRRSLAPLIEAGSVTWVRPFYVFDPETRRPAVLAELLAARDEGRPARLREPNARHDFVHVHDVATGMAQVVQQDLQGAVDLGSGRLRTVAQFASATGCDWVQEGAAAEDVVHANRAADISTLRAAGWAPTKTMRFFGDE
jgi:nucleoside-diphosphate-sugar epimerase